MSGQLCHHRWNSVLHLRHVVAGAGSFVDLDINASLAAIRPSRPAAMRHNRSRLCGSGCVRANLGDVFHHACAMSLITT